MKNLYDYTDQIAAEVAKISPRNYIIAGITPEGKLIIDESVDGETRFRPDDVVEQTSIQGGTPKVAISDRLAALAAMADRAAEIEAAYDATAPGRRK